jgi:hypothetical protein
MVRLFLACLMCICAASAASAQAPSPSSSPEPLNDSAKKLIGTWEFANADRDKVCTATFKGDPTAVGFAVTFDAGCAAKFPLVDNVAGWKYPEHDLLYLLNADGKALVEFSEVEGGIFEAPTPGVGVLFLRTPQAAAAEPKARTPQQVAGTWTLQRGNGTAACRFTLATTPAGDDYALTVAPGCEPRIAQLGFIAWNVDRGELVLTPSRGNPWRFEVVDDKSWALLPESADQTLLARQ